MGDDRRHEIQPAKVEGSVIPIGGAATVDLSALAKEERDYLLSEYRRGVLDVSRKASEMQVDVAALRATLDALATTTRSVSESGNSVTVTHSQTSSVGRTEVIMGNTDNAQKGRLSRSQAGDRDWAPWIIVAIVVVVVAIIVL